MNANYEILRNAMEMILFFDEKGFLSFANTTLARETGYVQEELKDLSVVTLFPKLFTYEGQRLRLQKEEVLQKEVKTSLYRKNTTCFTVFVKLLKLEEEHEYCLFAVNSCESDEKQREITKIRKENREAKKIRDEFVANVTHELRTPVNGIRGHAGYIRNKITDPELLKNLDLIEKSCINMQRLIDQILDFAKMESGHLVLEEREFSLPLCLEQLIETASISASARGLRMISNIDRSIPKVLIGDELRTSQIINNLISNAIKFTSAGFVALEVTLMEVIGDEAELFFMVIDSGIGMTKEEQQKLFQSFSQVDASITRQYGGTGLGLVITRELIQLMKGSIRVESEKGKGTTFSFSLRYRLPMDDTVLLKNNPLLGRIKVSEEIGSYDVLEINQYGTPANRHEVDENLTKLLICADMDNWERAELFVDNIKKLTLEAPGDLQREILRLTIAVRNENRMKIAEAKETVQRMLQGVTDDKK